MTNCTVSGNTATGVDGGICIQGTSTNVTDIITLTNCTISGNSTATTGGGGIGFGQGASGATWACNIVLNNCTITGNTSSGNTASSIGGGISKNGGTTVSLIVNYSIVAGNNSNSTVAGKDITSATGFLTSDTGRNLYGGTLSWGTSNTIGNVNLTADISTILNTTLADNGGTTALPDGSYVKTHALVSGGVAINPTAASSGLQTVDQRGTLRDGTPDMGAYEYVGTTTDVTKPIQLNEVVMIKNKGIEMLSNAKVDVYSVRGELSKSLQATEGLFIYLPKGISLIRVTTDKGSDVIKLAN
jgi:parallel beta-helix repeat protein